jgi:hypothetical protein
MKVLRFSVKLRVFEFSDEAVGDRIPHVLLCIICFSSFFVPGAGGGGREGGTLVKTEDETAKSFLEL